MMLTSPKLTTARQIMVSFQKVRETLDRRRLGSQVINYLCRKGHSQQRLGACACGCLFYCRKQIKMYQEVSGHQNLSDKQKARVKSDTVSVPHTGTAEDSRGQPGTASLTIGLDHRREKDNWRNWSIIHRSGVNTWGGSQILLGKGRQRSLA